MKRSMIIKRTAIAMTAVMMGFTFSGITAEAAGAKEAGTAATVVNEAAQKGIDQYIINAIKGRAGATSPTGAKVHILGLIFQAFLWCRISSLLWNHPL